MFGAKLNYNTKLVVDNYLLTGVESFSFDVSQSTNFLAPLGTTLGMNTISGPTTQNFSMTRNLIYDDPILYYTGEVSKPLRAYVSSDTDNSYYGFEEGFMTNYSVSCAVGSIPRVSTNFIIKDELEMSSPYIKNKAHRTIRVPKQGSIVIESPDFNEDRVVGFDYSVELNNKVFYTLGQQSVQSIDRWMPIRYKAVVQVELDKTVSESSFDFLGQPGVIGSRDLDISIKGRDFRFIQGLNIPNASLVRRTMSQSADGILRANLEYIGHGGNSF